MSGLAVIVAMGMLFIIVEKQYARSAQRERLIPQSVETTSTVSSHVIFKTRDRWEMVKGLLLIANGILDISSLNVDDVVFSQGAYIIVARVYI